MRVALVTGEYPPMRGGVADYTSLLAGALCRFGVEVSVLTSSRAAGSRNGDGPPRIVTSVKNWGPGSWHDVADHVEHFQPDIIHLQYQAGAFDLNAAVTVLPWVNRLRGGQPRLLVTFHDLKVPYILPKIGPARQLAPMLLSAGSDGVIVTNHEDYERMVGALEGLSRWYWGRREITAIPIGSNIPANPVEGYDRAEWRARLRVGTDEIVIAFFGFISPNKGVDTLITAFETLVRKGAPVRLLMVGATAGDSGEADRHYENSVRQRLDQPYVRGKVGWTGYASGSDVAAHLQAADICALPFRDGASLRHGTLIAAITHHLPIVTTQSWSVVRSGALPVLRSSENVVLVHPEDPVALAAAIGHLIEDPSLRSTLASNVAKVADVFHWDSIARQTLRVYQRLTNKIADAHY